MKYRKVLLSILAITSLAFLQGESYGSYVTKHLYAYWSFDQSTISGKSIKDLAGNNDATIKGESKIITGKYGQAIEFDGQDDYVELTTLKGFGSHLGSFSMDFWLKTSDTPDWTTLFKTLTDGLSMAWAIDLNRTAKPNWAYAEGNTHFYIRDETGKALAPEIQSNIYDNTWHHIAWVVENAESNACKIYVDGKEQDIVYAKVETPTSFIDFQHPVYVGTANNRGNIERFCPAAVDELRLYTAALTKQELIQNMESGAMVDSSGKLPALWGELKNTR